MKQNEKCPVCGQPLIIFRNRCENCKTFYCDLTSLNLQEREPFILKYKINNMEFVQYVRLQSNNPQIEFTSESKSEMISGLVMNNDKYKTKNLNTIFSFTALPFGEQENLLTIEVEGENNVI